MNDSMCTQLRNNVSIREYGQQLEQYQIICKDKQGGQRISNHTLKLKFINGLRPDLKLAIRRQINYYMSLHEKVAKAPVIADITKSALHKPTPAKDKYW